MDNLLFPILVALAAAALGWGVVQTVLQTLRPDRRRIAQRLTSGASEAAESADGQQRSILLQMEASGVSGSLARVRLFQRIYRNLVQAFPKVTLVQFLVTVGVLALVGFVVVSALFDSLVLGLVAGAVCAYLPFMLVSQRRARRQRAIVSQLPECLDFLGRILRAGHSLSAGFQMIGEELPAPISEEFRRAFDQHSLGQPLDEALKEMTTRIESTDFAFFVTAVLVQRQTGGDLSEILSNISGMIRQRVRLAMGVKSKTAEGRFTGYILVAFPAVMFLLIYALNPAYASGMLHSDAGLTMLGIAGALQMMGLYAIRKITTVRV